MEASLKNNMMNNNVRKSVKAIKRIIQKDLQILAIYREMNAGSTLDPQTIKMKMLQKKNMQQYLNNYLNCQVLIHLWIGIENILIKIR